MSSMFSKSNVKKIEKEQKQDSPIDKQQKECEKRQKLFIASDDRFRGLIYTVLTHFFRNCVESC